MNDNLIVARNASRVIGVLEGWDRLVFRGCCPLFLFVDGMLKWLLHMGIRLTEFSQWALATSEAMKRACLAEAERRRRPIRYLGVSGIRKDELARDILRENPVSEGLVCVLTCLEPCDTYRIRGNRGSGRNGVQVWINGREWLARRLDRRGIAYRRYDNCFPWIEDFDAAQKLMNRMQCHRWIRSLERILTRLCPGYRQRLHGPEVYWTAFQTEWRRSRPKSIAAMPRRWGRSIRARPWANSWPPFVGPFDATASVVADSAPGRTKTAFCWRRSHAGNTSPTASRTATSRPDCIRALVPNEANDPALPRASAIGCGCCAHTD